MVEFGTRAAERFCWVDLAATDAESAKEFYQAMFGWTSQQQAANGGHFRRFQLRGADVASMYQLNRRQIAHGTRSHWTPYIRIGNVEQAAERTVTLGGKILVRPFAVSDIARIALVADPVGAQFGLWETF